MSPSPARALSLIVAVAALDGCCFGGLGEGETTVLAEADLACSPPAHARRADVVTNAFEGVVETRREISFGGAAPLEAEGGSLGPWRPQAELPEHASSARMTDGAPAWLLAVPDDAQYRCLADHLTEIETVFGTEQGVVVVHAEHAELVPTFRARSGTTELSLVLSPDGSLFAQFTQGEMRNGVLIGQMVREPNGRVLALLRGPLMVPSLPAELSDASRVVAAARDERGRTLAERFAAETRLVELTELLELQP